MSIAALARSATRGAARLRADLGVGPAETVCPFDLAERVGVAVRIVALPTLEGMYSPEPAPTILVSAERPAGRRRYTCAHELGHHVFGHGTRLDEILENARKPWNPEEFAAQCFAAALMMPKLAVEWAFARRKWPIAKPTPEMTFIVAQELGVGFTTLVGHLERTLGYLPRSIAQALRRERLPQLRERVASCAVTHDLVIVDEFWGRRTIDIEVGDIVLLRAATTHFDGACVSLVDGPARHLIGIAPGIGSIILDGSGFSIAIRVSRREFSGVARYRHLEELDDE